MVQHYLATSCNRINTILQWFEQPLGMDAVAVFVAALALVPFVGFRLYARRVESMDESIEERLHRLDRLQQVGGFVLPTVAIVGIFWLDIPDRLADLVWSGPEPLGIDVLELAVTFVVLVVIAALPYVSMVVGTYPTVRSLRETAASTTRVARRALLGFVMVGAIVAIAVGGMLAAIAVVGSSLPVLVGALAVMVFVTFGLTPYLTLLFQDRVPLDGQRRDRVDRLCLDLGYTPRARYLLEGESTKTANAMVAGTVPGFRYVFLTDYLLEECDDDQLQAILAHEFGHVAGRHLWQRGVLTVAVFGGGIVAWQLLGLGIFEERFGFVGFFLPFMVLYVLYHVLFLGGLAYWQEFRADAYAARAVGPRATAGALETLAESNDTRRRSGLLYALATHHPPIGDRIDAVRARDDADSSDGSRESLAE